MVVHIGNLIAAKMQEMHISNITLAARLQMVRMNVHSILKRKTMQTDLLDKIGKAMNYDFFQHYSRTAEDAQKTNTELLSRVALLEKKLQDAEQDAEKKLKAAESEISTLNRIVEVLKGKG